jgi:hypothetical protein
MKLASNWKERAGIYIIGTLVGMLIGINVGLAMAKAICTF